MRGECKKEKRFCAQWAIEALIDKESLKLINLFIYMFSTYRRFERAKKNVVLATKPPKFVGFVLTKKQTKKKKSKPML